MFYVLSIGNDIKFGVLDILRSIGMGLVNIIYNTIDVLYNVAHKINSLNFIQILENVENSPFTKIFNSFFVLAFAILFLFAVWKITFRIFDADENQEQSLFSLIKEIFKCGFLIFLVSLIFNQGITLGIYFSNAIYNNFTTSNSTIGDNMKTAYLTVNENCYYNSLNQANEKSASKTDKENVDDLKEQLSGYVSIPSSVTTVEDFNTLIRNGKLTATNITDSGAFSLTCQIYKAGIWNDGEDYFFNYNWVFGILVGTVFLFAIGFSVIMLGRRQLEIAFLMLIAPLVFATSVGRKEQRSALYQQLVSLVLQAGALLLLIGLTSIMFNAIQNSSDINALPYFTKIVAQSVLYLGCAMMLLTGSTTLNRFIGENVSANSGRDMMLAMRGMFGGIVGAGAMGIGAVKTAKNMAVGGFKTGKGMHQLAKGLKQMAGAGAMKMASKNSKLNDTVSKGMENKLGKGLAQMFSGDVKQTSKNPLTRAVGKIQSNRGNKAINELGKKWDFKNNALNSEYFTSGKNLAYNGLSNIKAGMQTTFNNVGSIKTAKKIPLSDYKGNDEKL